VPPAVAHVDVVVPTLGRSSLPDLVGALCRALPEHSDVVVVDDRDGDPPPLDVGPNGGRLRVVRSGGRGPAAARNAGWRASRAPWVAFVDDDVDLPSDWVRGLIRDLREAPADVAAVQGRVEVPLPPGRRPTDWERNVAGLDGAAWITADMAVRRPALEEVGGFDERFTRAYREDTDLALRLLDAGWRLRVGERRVRHPVRPAPWWVSVTLQRGNADDVLLERLHGRAWRERIDAAGDGAGPRRGAWHTYPLTSVLGAAAVVALAAGRPRLAVAAGAAWAVRTGRFAWQRIGPGPRHPAEVAAMVATSAAIPPVACYQRARGLARWRAAQPRPAGSPER
jgi:glycosyltransferase involved in cell wall biosynthesis